MSDMLLLLLILRSRWLNLTSFLGFVIARRLQTSQMSSRYSFGAAMESWPGISDDLFPDLWDAALRAELGGELALRHVGVFCTAIPVRRGSDGQGGAGQHVVP